MQEQEFKFMKSVALSAIIIYGQEIKGSNLELEVSSSSTASSDCRVKIDGKLSNDYGGGIVDLICDITRKQKDFNQYDTILNGSVGEEIYIGRQTPISALDVDGYVVSGRLQLAKSS